MSKLALQNAKDSTQDSHGPPVDWSDKKGWDRYHHAECIEGPFQIRPPLVRTAGSRCAFSVLSKSAADGSGFLAAASMWVLSSTQAWAAKSWRRTSRRSLSESSGTSRLCRQSGCSRDGRLSLRRASHRWMRLAEWMLPNMISSRDRQKGYSTLSSIAAPSRASRLRPCQQPPRTSLSRCAQEALQPSTRSTYKAVAATT